MIMMSIVMMVMVMVMMMVHVMQGLFLFVTHAHEKAACLKDVAILVIGWILNCC